MDQREKKRSNGPPVLHLNKDEARLFTVPVLSPGSLADQPEYKRLLSEGWKVTDASAQIENGVLTVLLKAHKN